MTSSRSLVINILSLPSLSLSLSLSLYLSLSLIVLSTAVSHILNYVNINVIKHIILFGTLSFVCID